MADHSIVEYFGSSNDGHRCGYCGSSNGNYSHGMWAHNLTCMDYQDLIDRGWRRSGKYLYKPTMKKTCCPLYTIKCDATSFQPSKSQKKVLKKMTRFLTVPKTESNHKEESVEGESDEQSGCFDTDGSAVFFDHAADIKPSEMANLKDFSIYAETKSDSIGTQGASTSGHSTERTRKLSRERPPAPGLGPDPNKPPRQKARYLRLTSREQRLALAQEDMVDAGSNLQSSKTSISKSLEDLLIDSLPNQSPVHNLQIKLVPSDPNNPEFSQTFPETAALFFTYQRAIHNDPPEKCTKKRVKLVRVDMKSAEFQATFKQSHVVFAKYQMVIHKDSPDDCSELQFKRFLVDSPLVHLSGDGAPLMGYGSFHQQYFIDGKLVAVGVLDILPRCVSSVYLFYDPDYSFLSLGHYSALRELYFTRSLQRSTPSIRSYYMGFYVHSCTKMRYKGQYSPSYLACPETYNWVPIEQCTKKLDRSKYSRLDDSDEEAPSASKEDVLALYSRQAIPYPIYRAITRADDEDEVTEYAQLVGPVVATRMLLYRSG